MNEPIIRALRRKGWSFRRLAFETGLSAGYLCRVAGGQRRPSRSAAIRIGEVLGLGPWSVRDYGATRSHSKVDAEADRT